jgi:hypothetical protein
VGRLPHAEVEDEWREIQAARAEAALIRAEDGLETASDAIAVARTREQIKAAQWRLERLKRRLYGQDHHRTSLPVAIQINIGRSDQEAIPIAPEES